MPILVPGSLLTVTDVQTYLRLKPLTNAADKASAEAAVASARALVVQRLGFDPEDGVTDVADTDFEAIRAVAVRVAALMLTNPQDRQTFAGPEGLSYAGSPQVVGRMMSEADRVVLQMVALKHSVNFGGASA